MVARKYAAFWIATLILVLSFASSTLMIIKPALQARELVFSSEFSHYLVFCLSLFGIILLNEYSKHKLIDIYLGFADLKRILKVHAKKHKNNPYMIFLLFIEIAFVIVIASLLYFYLDPSSEKPKIILAIDEHFGFFAPFVKFLTFVILLAIFMYIHSLALKANAIGFKKRATS